MAYFCFGDLGKPGQEGVLATQIEDGEDKYIPYAKLAPASVKNRVTYAKNMMPL